MNKIFRVIWSHAQQAWVVVSELVKSHTKTSTYTDKRAQLCTSHYFLDKQQDKFKLSFLSLVLLGIFFSPVGSAAYFQDGAGPSPRGSNGASIGIGNGSRAGHGAIVIGEASKAEAHTSIAIGYSTGAEGEGSIAIGRDSIASQNEGIAIGRGSASRSKQSVALGARANATQSEAIAIGSGAAASSIQSVAIGKNTKASGYSSISIGYGANAAASESISLGIASKATQTEGVAIGARSTSNGYYGVAVGSSSTASDYAVAVGKSAIANKTGASAFGENAQATAERATALGNNATADKKYGVALGYQSKTSRDSGQEGWKPDDTSYSITGNTLSATHAAVAVGDDTSSVTRQITGVAAGKEDTDAANVAQLKALTLKISGDGGTKGHTTFSNETLSIVGGDNGISTAVEQANGKTKITLKLTPGEFGPTTDGRLSVKTAGLATVDAVVTAVNNAGWKLAIAKGAGTGEATPPEAHLIKMGQTATFTAGNNIKLEQTNGNITISTLGKLIKETKILEGGGLKIIYTDDSSNIIRDGAPGPVGPRGPAGPKGERGEPG
ncbi:ESPR-type extended signal peptide-containing protein, partial [Glaesserella parasuis]|nr:ESPR-type extended signal peptide-containing protein [Glaesserella parasuis]